MSFGYQLLGFGSGGGAKKRIVATGGTVTEDGDFKIHTFTSGGTFDVTEAPTGETVDWMIVAGGGGAGCRMGAAGGAGGMRFSFPNAEGAGTPVSVQGYPVTIGSGGSTAGSNNNVAGQAGQNCYKIDKQLHYTTWSPHMFGYSEINVKENTDNNNVVLKGVNETLNKLEKKIDEYSGNNDEVEIVPEKDTFHDKFIKDLADNTPHAGQFDEKV